MKKRKVSISQVLNIISLVAVMLLGFQIYLTCPSQDDSLNRTERQKVAQRNEFTKSNAKLRGLVGVGTLNKHGTGSNNGNKKKRSKFSTRLAFNVSLISLLCFNAPMLQCTILMYHLKAPPLLWNNNHIRQQSNNIYQLNEQPTN